MTLPRPLAVLALVCACTACARPERHVDATEAVLEREVAGLRSLVSVAQAGPLVPFDQVLVVVDQKLVQGLLTAATPYEREIGERYRLRVESVEVNFEDGFALVRLEGLASFRESAKGQARFSLFAGLDVLELDAASGILRGRLRIIALEARRVEVLGMEAPGRHLVESLGREKLETFSALASQLEIPVRVESEIAIPATGPAGGVTIQAATIPLQAAVSRVTAYGGRLWVTVTAGLKVDAK